MGCAASTNPGVGAIKQGGAVKFTNATGEEPSERSVRQIDTAAIEEQSHINGEQSLLALAMSAPPTADTKQYFKTSLRVPVNVDGGRRQPHSSEIDMTLHQTHPPDAGDLSTITTTTSAAAASGSTALSLSISTSPIKIRVQEPLSTIVTTEEHEYAKLLPDLKYSMRSSAARQQQATSDTSQFGFSDSPTTASAASTASAQSRGTARRLQPITSNTISPGGGTAMIDDHTWLQHGAGAATLAQRNQPLPLSMQLHTLNPAGAAFAADPLLVAPHVVVGRGVGVMPLEFISPQGRGVGIAGRGFPGSVSPLLRGPVAPTVQGSVASMGVHPGGRGVVVAGPRGLPRPLLAVSGRGGSSQQAQNALWATEAVERQHQLVSSPLAYPHPQSLQSYTSNGSTTPPNEQRVPPQHSAKNDSDDDDDDDFVDDDEVDDWDLNDEQEDTPKAAESTPVRSHTTAAHHASPAKTPPLTTNSSGSHSLDAPHSFAKQQQQPLKAIQAAKSAVPASPPPRPPKFRPAFNNIDDVSTIVSVASQVESDDGDDDDDSNFGDDNEDVEDWFEADTIKGDATSSVTDIASAYGKKQLLPRDKVESAAGAKLVAGNPTVTTAGSLYVSVAHSAATTPTFRHTPGTDAAKSSPHPPPIQRLPSRQTVAPGSLSPTKQSGTSSPLAGSPLKQVSYRSNIVGAGQPVLLPMALNALSGGGGKDPAANAPIRDTNVVKKKRAELPQRNLPHPTPKFGDWLNSRTMINNYIILEALGSGSYAEVKLCKEKVSGKLFAMKFINRDIMKKDKLGKQSKLDDIKREIAIMKKLNHPNVLRLYEVMDDPSMNKLFLVLEYMKHGDLLSHQKKKHASGGVESLHDRDLHCVVLQVVLGLAYLHEQKIVHGDIKPQNILVGNRDAVKIADFGISQSLYGSKQKLSDTAGTPAFMSPEMCSGEEYSGQMADIWAVGATIFMLKFGNPPFVAKSALQMFEKIQHDPLVFPFPIDPLLQDLLTGMMVKDPQQRMALEDVLAHPWITREETLSSYSSLHRQDAPRITVSSDEIEYAIHSKDQFAVIVNIRIQMMKKLQKARQEVAKRNRRLLADNESGSHEHADRTARVDAAAALPAITLAAGEATNVGRDLRREDVAGSDELHHKSMKLKSPKIRQNRVHADQQPHRESCESSRKQNSRDDAACHENKDSLSRSMLSSEEISYRAHMFSRKKTGSTAVSASKSRDQGACGFESDADAENASQGTEDDDDENALSTDDDDEAAVAQSPQLLDELLLTTLSMPPLSKTKSPSDDLALNRPVNAIGTGTTSAEGTHEMRAYESQIRAPSALSGNDKGTFYGESSTLALRFGVASLQGRRSTQEDRWVALPQISGVAAPQWTSSAFVGLYDGHGGDECSSILHEQLHAWIFRDPHDCTLTAAGLQTCFEELDTYVCDYLLQKGDLSGSTATCVILQPSGDGAKIRGIAAHVGDCRLVLGLRSSNEVRDITQDHRLTVSAERERILARGGRVVNNRVNGVMAITRAFGDLEFKGLLGRPANSASALALPVPDTVQQNPFQHEEEKIPALLTARPDVHDFELDPQTHEFLLLACDGLWDVMTSDEAADIFRDRLHFHANVQLAAKELAQEAIRRYSNDNITIVAVQVVLR